MDRRDFIKHTGAAAAAAAGVAAGASSAAKADARDAEQAFAPSAPHVAGAARELRITAPWPQTGRGLSDSTYRLAQSILVLSDGRLRVNVDTVPAGFEAHDAPGRAELHHVSGRDLAALDRAFAYFGGVPGSAAMRPTYLNAWLTAGAQSLWDDLAARHGFKALLAGHAGARAKLWSTTPITSMVDLKGMRIAADAVTADIIRELGAEPVRIAPAGLGDALLNGSVDAVEGGGTIAGFGHDLHRSAKFCLRPGFARSGASTVLTVRADIWNDLRPADQSVIAAAALQEFNTVVAENLSQARPLRTALAERHQIAFGATPADVGKSATDAADRWVADTATSSPAAERIAASYMAFRNGLPGVRRKASTTPLA